MNYASELVYGTVILLFGVFNFHSCRLSRTVTEMTQIVILFVLLVCGIPALHGMVGLQKFKV